MGFSDEHNSCFPGSQKTKTGSKCLGHTRKCFRYYLHTLLPVTCCTKMASKSLKTTIWQYMAHFGPFRTSNMGVIRPSGGHISLKMPQTHPKVLQIPSTCIAISHRLYPHGPEIAQNRPNGVKNRVAQGRSGSYSAICLYFPTSNRSRRVSWRSYIAILSEIDKTTYLKLL